MKKTLLLIAALYGLIAYATEAPTPVAVWNGDFSTTVKDNYTLSANGNTVATDGSSITISTAATKGVQVLWSTSITPSLTVIVKHTGLPAHSTLATLAAIKGGQPTSYNDNRVGVNLQANTSYKTIGYWNGGTGSRLTPDAEMDPAATTYALKYHAVRNDANRGTYLIQKNTDGSTTQIYYEQGLVGSGDVIDGVTIGGNAANAGSNYANFEIIGIAIFDSLLTDAEIAAYEFPKVAKKNESVLLLNFGKSNPTGWVTCNEMNVGGNIPQTGTLSQEGSSATFRIAGGGNFFNEDNKDFDLVTNGTFSNGTYRGTDGKDYGTIEAEVKASLGLADNIVFDSSVYGCGLQNGGYSDHTATIGGLDATAKYIVYVGYGMHKSNQCAGFKITSDQCSSVDSIDYVTTVAGTGTSVANAYTAAEVGAELRPGENGLLIVRLTNVVPTSSGEIKFAPHGERSGINFLAVAKVNEIEEPGEEEEMVTIDYPATGFLTSEYQDTGWQVTLEEILKYGSFTGTMDGGYVSGNNVPAQGFHKKTGTDGSVAVVEFQMQIYQEGTSASDKYLKATRVYAKEQAGTIWLRAVQSGNIQYGTLGTEITNWNGTLAQNATADGYGVASVALSITKPADKKPQGSIGEVTTTPSEDYTSNTITAKVTLENGGEYKGEAVLVYVLNGTTNEVAVAEGQTTLTINGLEQEKVYRGTLALGQKIGEDVTVIEGTEIHVALYQGEQKFVWTEEGEWINETATTKDSTGKWTEGISVNSDKLVVNTASGVTFTPTANPDYVEKCDSKFTVSISASEAIDAASDPTPSTDVQGGVRIASVGGVLKVQALADGTWADLKASGVDIGKDYEVVVAFHYAKDGVKDDADSVSYTLDGVTVTGGKVANTVAKISSVEVADGTSLAFLKGICELDKAVVVDVEIDPGAEKPIEAKDLAAAQAIADKMVIAISEEVAKVVDATTYRGYFKVVAKEGSDGKFHAIVEFLPGVQDAIEDDIEKSMETVVAGFETGSAEIAAKPGLYYGVKRGASPDKLEVEETTLAKSEKVTITITKPNNSSKHFYRIICSPTPNH